MKQPKLYIFLIALGITSLFLFALFEKFRHNTFTILRPVLHAKESFTNVPLRSETYDISNADKPYLLLSDTLPTKNCLGMLDANRCYNGSFQSRIEKTGNYKQLTNNYRHEDVESCSAPFTEFVNSFYKVEPLN